MASDIRLAETAFDPGAEITGFATAHARAGGIVSFTGQVRAGDAVEALDQLYADARARGWSINRR